MQTYAAPSFGKFTQFCLACSWVRTQKDCSHVSLFSLISFVYNVLRCMKITLVVSTAGSGAEVIPFLKVWAVLPGAIFLTFIYTELSVVFDENKCFILFYHFLWVFLSFLCWCYIPIVKFRTGSVFRFFTIKITFQRIKWIFRHYSSLAFSLFYVLSELWSAVVLSMLFWGFANEITKVDEAKRFYAIFALGANFSGIFSGQCAQFLTLHEYHPNLPFWTYAWEQSLFLQIWCVLCLGL